MRTILMESISGVKLKCHHKEKKIPILLNISYLFIKLLTELELQI